MATGKESPSACPSESATIRFARRRRTSGHVPLMTWVTAAILSVPFPLAGATRRGCHLSIGRWYATFLRCGRLLN
jgi:hypothetical protein